MDFDAMHLTERPIPSAVEYRIRVRIANASQLSSGTWREHVFNQGDNILVVGIALFPIQLWAENDVLPCAATAYVAHCSISPEAIVRLKNCFCCRSCHRLRRRFCGRWNILQTSDDARFLQSANVDGLTPLTNYSAQIRGESRAGIVLPGIIAVCWIGSHVWYSLLCFFYPPVLRKKWISYIHFKINPFRFWLIENIWETNRTICEWWQWKCCSWKARPVLLMFRRRWNRIVTKHLTVFHTYFIFAGNRMLCFCLFFKKKWKYAVGSLY